MNKTTLNHRRRYIIPVVLAGLVSLLAYGCQESAAPTTKQASVADPNRKGGAQLWSDNCARCHNLQPPTQHSNGEWAVIIHHMRVRADLTGNESREILDFLKSANMQ